jgi:hypothetical protein
MTFEEVYSDSCSEDNCDLQVFDEKSNDPWIISEMWNDIQTIEEETLVITSWWPETATLILQGMYGSASDKKIAIGAFMKIFEFTPVYVDPLTFSPEMYKFHNLYNQKLKIHEEHLTMLKNEWCKLLRECAQKCKDIDIEKNHEIQRLKYKANEIYMKMKQQKQTHVHIIKEEYEKTMNEIRKEYNFKMKLVKSAYHYKTPNDYLQEIQKINQEINDLLTSTSYTTIKQLDEQYKQECNNLQYKIGLQLQDECQQHWMNSLL